MPQTLKTNAIVLRKRNLPNQDIFLSLFTEESGKMSLIAKGIKKITSKRQPHIQTGNLISVIVQKKHDRYYLQDTSLVSAFVKIKNDETKMKHLYLALFVIDRLLPENQQDTQLFSNLQEYLIALSEQKTDRNRLFEFMNRLMIHLGYTVKPTDPDSLKTTIENLIHEKLPVDTV